MKKLCVILCLLVSSVFGADKLRPLADAVAAMENKGGEPDLSEMAYVGSRCAALYICVGDYLIEAAREEKDKKYGEAFKARAEIFWKISTDINTKLKMSPENILAQAKLFVDYYSKEMADNKRLNNIAITEFITADLDQAKKVFPLFDSIVKEAAKAEAGK